MASGRALSLLAALWLLGAPASVGVVPCDAQSAVMARESRVAELVEPQPQPALVSPTGSVPVGELFEVAVHCPVPEGTTPTLSWRINGQPADPKHLRLVGAGLTGIAALPPGRHTFSVTGAWGVVEAGNQVRITLVDVTGVVTVGQAPPVPPDEPAPPKPGTLAALIPDPAKRALAAEFYADLAAEVRKGAFTSTSHFRSGYRLAIKNAQDTGALPTGIAAIDKPISDRITAAITLADVPLDAAKQAALAACLDGVAAELGG